MTSPTYRTIVCFGDSNTHGYDTATDGRFDAHTRWTGVLQDELDKYREPEKNREPEEKGTAKTSTDSTVYYVKEEGLGGRNTVFEDPLTEGMSGLSMIYPVLMTHEPVDLLIIMLGTNDTKERFGATPVNIATGLNRLIRKASAATEAWRDGKPNILIVCPPPILPVYRSRKFAGEMGEGADKKSTALAPLFTQVAASNDCAFLDAATIPGVQMSERYCGMHMEASAHQALGKALAEQVIQLVEARL